MVVAAMDNHDINTRSDFSRTELDSHANMIVVGQNATVIDDTGRTASVSPFNPSYKAMKEVHIIDAAIVYDCPHRGLSYILLCHNALHVPSMVHNIVPPFIMREAGIIVNDTPKIHVEKPSEIDHSLYFEEVEKRIPLSLHGIFSYFPTRKPTEIYITNELEILHLTPNTLSWDPHSEVYAINEENIMDYEEKVLPPSDRIKVLISDLEHDESMLSSLIVGSVESSMIDKIS